MPESPARRHVRLRAGVLATIAAVVLLTMSGCSGAPAPTAAPAPSSAAAPIFATDEEALAAAEAAYGEFESVSQAIASQSGADADRIADVATPAYVPDLLDEFAQYAELGIHVEGNATLDHFSLVQQELDESGIQLTIYVCRDVSGVVVRDSNGADVTPADRDDRTPLIASLVGTNPTDLAVDTVELWSGDDFC
jgi:hypothetical protein